MSQRKVSVVKDFINLAMNSDEIHQIKAEQQSLKASQKCAQAKNKNEANQVSYDGLSDPNFYKHYVDQFEYGDTNRVFVPEPKHKYTIHLHRAVYTEELYALYKRYEQHVHKKDRPPQQLQRFLCNSPLYDPDMEPHKAHACMLFNSKKIDQTYHKW